MRRLVGGASGVIQGLLKTLSDCGIEPCLDFRHAECSGRARDWDGPVQVHPSIEIRPRHRDRVKAHRRNNVTRGEGSRALSGKPTSVRRPLRNSLGVTPIAHNQR